MQLLREFQPRTSSQNDVVPCRVFTEMRRVFLDDKISGREVGAVAQGSGHEQDLGFGGWTYAGVVMQRPMHGADRGSQGLRNVTKSRGRFSHLSWPVLLIKRFKQRGRHRNAWDP